MMRGRYCVEQLVFGEHLTTHVLQYGYVGFKFQNKNYGRKLTLVGGAIYLLSTIAVTFHIY